MRRGYPRFRPVDGSTRVDPVFNNWINWYIDHAALLFTVLVVTAVAMEQIHRRLRGRDPESKSMATTFASGLAFLIVKGIVGKLAITTLALFVFDHFRLLTLDLSNTWVWVAVFVARDFIYYWVHRAEHSIRVLWASHMVHHSPETIGFVTALRVPWMEAVYKPWFGLWLPLIGFHPFAAIAMDVFAATIAQLYHTEAIRRIPVLEHIFVTPSTHRVHHGSNAQYIDKNFGAVFIVWDRLFGTFQPETVPVVYGIGPDKRIDTPAAALVGGYPALVDAMRPMTTWSQRVRFAMSAPG